MNVSPNENLERFLQPSPYLDADHESVAALSREATADSGDAREVAVRLFYIVRDRFLYDPYKLDLSDDGFKASTVIAQGRGYCVTKAGLLVALARAASIPARLGFADVRSIAGGIEAWREAGLPVVTR